MAETFKGLITDEGIDQARFVDDFEKETPDDPGWFITPFKFSVAEEKGLFNKSRDLASRNPIWLEDYFTKIEKFGNNKLLLTVTINGDADDVQRRIGEVYITAKTKQVLGGDDEENAAQEYLYCLTQTVGDSLIFNPGVTLEFSLYIALNNQGVSDTYTIEYYSPQDLSWYQLRSEKSQPNGYASLGEDGKVPEDELPIMLPDQTGNGGKFLSTNGDTAYWDLAGVKAIYDADTPSPITETLTKIEYTSENAFISKSSVDLDTMSVIPYTGNDIAPDFLGTSVAVAANSMVTFNYSGVFCTSTASVATINFYASSTASSSAAVHGTMVRVAKGVYFKSNYAGRFYRLRGVL